MIIVMKLKMVMKLWIQTTYLMIQQIQGNNHQEIEIEGYWSLSHSKKRQYKRDLKKMR